MLQKLKPHLPALLAVLSCCLVLVCVFRIQSLKEQVRALSDQLSTQTSQVQGAVNGISEQVRASLEEQASLLTESDFTYGDTQLNAQTAQVSVRIVPKVFTPDSTEVAVLVGDTEQPLTFQNGAYSATLTLPFFQPTEVSQVLIRDGGTVRTQVLNWTLSPKDNVLLQGNVWTTGETAGSTWWKGGTTTWKPGELTMDLYRSGGLSLQSMEIVVVKNDKEFLRLPADPAQVDSESVPAESVGGDSESRTLFFSLDRTFKLKAGERMVLYLDLVDDLGVRYRFPAAYCLGMKNGSSPDPDWEQDMDTAVTEGQPVLFTPEGKLALNPSPDLLWAG